MDLSQVAKFAIWDWVGMGWVCPRKQMVLDLLSSSICYLGSGVGQGRPGMGTGFGFFSEPGSFGARQEVGVYGGLGPL